MKHILWGTATVFSLLFIGGCTSSTARCYGDTGSFCYQGYDFGPNRTAKYKLGVKHGCTTANGHFVKLYKFSRSSTEYLKGWDKGRATCKLIIPESAQPGTMRTQYQQSIDEKKYYGRR